MKPDRGLVAPLALVVLAVCLVGCASQPAPAAAPLEGTVEALLTQVSAQSTEIARQLEILSYLATRAPPLPASPAIRPSRTPFVTGSVIIMDGMCCVGALVGHPVVISVVFQAASPVAAVSEMRVRAGATSFTQADMENTAWEPFSSRKVFEHIAPLNWSGFFVTVQYRDALGNLSDVYWDDISVEGMPSAPGTSTP